MYLWRRQPGFIPTALVLILAGVSGSAEAATPETDGLLTAVKERLHALSEGNKETWSRLTADDAFFVTDTGTLREKAAALAKLSPSAGQDVLTVSGDVLVRKCGTAVLVSYVAREVESFPSGPVGRDIRRTEAWMRRDGRWQMVSGQSTIVPQMHWSVVTVDPKLLDEYTGQYEWYPGKVDTVSREGNRLYSQLSDEDQKDELLAVNESTFFARDDPSFGMFVRGPQGRVTHYVLRFWDGQALSARKIK